MAQNDPGDDHGPAVLDIEDSPSEDIIPQNDTGTTSEKTPPHSPHPTRLETKSVAFSSREGLQDGAEDDDNGIDSSIDEDIDDALDEG